MEIIPDSWSFGDMYWGATKTHRFLVHNAGDALLKVISVETGCQPCTASILTDDSVDPGGYTELLVTYRGKPEAGESSSSVSIRTDDPVNPMSEILLTANMLSSGRRFKNTMALSMASEYAFEPQFRPPPAGSSRYVGFSVTAFKARRVASRKRSSPVTR
ncbi:MAG: DUF1573 domain-containing protein [Planctomycetes bacterium]|nr:DUF1573 domain-containing protein [Planctomycetota bacterium]